MEKEEIRSNGKLSGELKLIIPELPVSNFEETEKILGELKVIGEEWKQLIKEMKSAKQLPATYYLKFSRFVEYMGVGRPAAEKIARAAGAKVWIDNVQLINVLKVHEYLDSINQ